MNRYRAAGVFCALAALAIIPYIPFLTLPFISDDYLQVYLGRRYGPVSGWPELAGDALYRCRATSLVLTYWTERWFGLSPLAFNASSILLHVLNTWIIFAFGSWRRIGWKLSTVAAAFFAVYQGHQEAVVWYAAVHEPLVFLFGAGAVLLWTRWLHAETAGARAVWYAGALCSFMLALLSKESAVAFVPVLALVAWWETGPRKALLATAPAALLAGAYTLSIFLQQTGHLHFGDGTFSLTGPFWLTLPNSIGRLFWIWGAMGLLALRCWQGDWERWWPVVRAAVIWMAITLLPYSFLTYMPRVPSRHTYLASGALGLVVGAAFLSFYERFASRVRWAPAAVAALLMIHQCGYLWTKKYDQYAERAEPTQELLRYAREKGGVIRVYQFPYGTRLAQLAVEVGAPESGATVVEASAPDEALPLPTGGMKPLRQTGL